jgi:hypothetical protein
MKTLMLFTCVFGAVMLCVGWTCGSSPSGLSESEVQTLVQEEVARQLAGIDTTVEDEVRTQLASLDELALSELHIVDGNKEVAWLGAYDDGVGGLCVRNTVNDSFVIVMADLNGGQIGLENRFGDYVARLGTASDDGWFKLWNESGEVILEVPESQ